jgi:general secretion pathway protein G
VISGAVSTVRAERVKRAHEDARGLFEGITAYERDCGAYPAALADLFSDPKNGAWKGPYAKTSADAAADPCSHPWVYTHTAEGFTVASYGADGVPGGQGPDADVEVSSR